MAHRNWHAVVSICVAAALGVVTNLVTGSFSWTLTFVALALVITQLIQSRVQGRHDRQDRRASRDNLLGLLRPTVLPDLSDPSAGVVFWLTAPYAPTPLWGRAAVRDRLVDWCVGTGEKGATVLTGPSGIGKSRLALAVAKALPADWVSGYPTTVDGIVDRIVACGDPTLLIVENAECFTGLKELVIQATRHPHLVRLLLLTREPRRLDELRPHFTVELLEPVGGEGDRKRWFAEATRAYARALGVPPPDDQPLPVGHDDDTLLVLHARALLAVAARTDPRMLSLREIATELLALEQQCWISDDVNLPPGLDPEVLAEAITVLLLVAADNIPQAADLLRRVPQLAHESSHESRMATARWVLRRYPGTSHRHADLRPHLIADRLLIDTLTRTPQLLYEDVEPAVITRVTEAYDTFPDGLNVLTTLLHRHHHPLSVGLTAVFAAGVATLDLDRALASLVLPANEDALVVLTIPEKFPYLALAVGTKAVSYCRETTDQDPEDGKALSWALRRLGRAQFDIGEYRQSAASLEEAVAIDRALRTSADEITFARSLISLCHSLWNIGTYPRAQSAVQEAIDILRGLRTDGLRDHLQDLAGALNALGGVLRERGQLGECVATMEEAVAVWREFCQNRDDVRLARALGNLGTVRYSLRQIEKSQAASEEAIRMLRRLIAASPGEFEADLARYLNGQSAVDGELGRYQQCAHAQEEAVAILRVLAIRQPDIHEPELARCLNNLSGTYSHLGHHTKAVAHGINAVAIQRRLATQEHERYDAGLVAFLNNLGAEHTDLHHPDEALTTLAEAETLARQLPGQHQEILATVRYNQCRALMQVGRYRDADTALVECVTVRRELLTAEGTRLQPALAQALALHADLLGDMKRPAESLAAQQESIVLWEESAAVSPKLYGESYRSAAVALHRQLIATGHVDADIPVLGKRVKEKNGHRRAPQQ
jgi:tetratricopeptide (TPR) repeat protein